MDTTGSKSAALRRIGAVGAALALAGGLIVAGGSPAAAYTPAMSFAGVAAYDRDRSQDIVARDNRTGLLWLYPGQSTRGYSNQPRVQIGNGWGGLTFGGLADYDRDGHRDIVVRDDTSGLLWLYPGQSKRGYSNQPRAQIGNHWKGFTFAGIADFDRDGHQDIITRDDSSGLLWLYPGESKRGYSGQGRFQIGNGWNGHTFAGIADYDRDGSQDIIVRNDANGRLWLYPGQSTRRYSDQARAEIGNGW